MHLIGINGYKGSGKGETSAAVVRLLGPGPVVREVGFADKVKLMAARSAGWSGTDEMLLPAWNHLKGKWHLVSWDNKGTRLGAMSDRQFIQNLGHGARMTFGDDFWVDQVLPREQAMLQKMYPGVDVLVLPDLRYENEAQRVLDLGGVIWEVIRPGVTSDGHESEQPLPRGLVTWQIFNDGGIDDLDDLVGEALDNYPC